MTEFWTNGAGLPQAFVRRARRAEAAGFDGITIVDSQNLSGDCYIALAMAAAATTTIKLGTGVTNPFTRHPAVTAGAIATVQAVSEGRAHLGIGRGDSALAHLGYAPAAPRTLADYLRKLQSYLAGDAVPFDEAGDLAKLRLANQPTSSRIGWIRPGRYPKVTVDVTATGPKVIAIGATHGDMVSFAVGADPTRVRWGIDTARAARAAAGLDPDALALSAYVNVVVHDDPGTARRLGEGGLSLFARFSAMHGTAVGPSTAAEKRTFEDIHAAYDMTVHSRSHTPQAAILTDEFAREFGIFGRPAYCVERLRELMALGITRFVVVGPSRDADRAEIERAEERFATEVMPALRA
ncbi:MAG TPA: LLM class flavin-dependent oxidoreductase [Candidatus Acidoferrum sp.]|nr:LLM class flavin-dependent oxidoreductase [Candidatus Acidoferrum sp.]